LPLFHQRAHCLFYLPRRHLAQLGTHGSIRIALQNGFLGKLRVASCVFTHPYKEPTPKKVGRKPQKVGRKPLSLPNSTGQGQLLEGEEKS
jgi:hypothetical protein